MDIAYIGNGAYCYANSASMLLASINENVSPSTIEVLTGVSLGATFKKNGLLYFNNQVLQPDLGITQALTLLGFETKTKTSDSKDNFPIDELKKDLTKGPVILGPLGMGHLTYNPNHKYLYDADHFVLAYGFEKDKIYLHDPAGFPHVWIQLNGLKKAWQAQRVSYRKGYYRNIAAPKKVLSTTPKIVYKSALEHFKNLYKEGIQKTNRDIYLINEEAIEFVANEIKNNGLSDREISHFVYFAFPLASKRASDYAVFFNSFNPSLSEIKTKQAQLFGKSYSLVRVKDWNKLSEVLKELAKTEKLFQEKLFKAY